MRDVAAREGVSFLDLENIFTDSAHFYDDLHLNSGGSRALAELIFNQLGGRLGLSQTRP